MGRREAVLSYQGPMFRRSVGPSSLLFVAFRSVSLSLPVEDELEGDERRKKNTNMPNIVRYWQLGRKIDKKYQQLALPTIPFLPVNLKPELGRSL